MEAMKELDDEEVRQGLTSIIVFSLAVCFAILVVAKNTANPDLGWHIITMPIWIVPALFIIVVVVFGAVDLIKNLIGMVSGKEG